MTVGAHVAVLACGRFGYDPTSMNLSTAPGADGSVSSGDARRDGTRDAVAEALPPHLSGCADGEREGFMSPEDHPLIAACAGGWTVPGVIGVAGPACGRAGGDDGANPDGVNCSAEDLCAAGWHLCRDRQDVAASSPNGCIDLAPAASAGRVFYATSQRSAGHNACDDQGTDNVHGCGTMGVVSAANCRPLERSSGNRCMNIDPPWDCSNSRPGEEALTVAKPAPGGGGVLCCRD